MKEKELLEEQLSKLNNIELEKLSEWRTETLPIISEIFNQKSSQYSQFCNIGCLSMQGYTNSHLNQFKKCMEGMIKCIDLRESQTTHSQNEISNHSIIINNNHNINQSQTLNISDNIIDVIKEEIPPSKMKEIQNIACCNEPKESKIQKIGTILQKTGIDVVSCTLAKIIANLIV